jgi:acyl-CoA hydrolase
MQTITNGMLNLNARRLSVSQQAKTPSASTTTIAKIMMPMDANVVGNVFGGTILDEVASIVASKHARSNPVTASTDQVNFLAPVFIGDLLRLIASINYVHKTSMEIGVRVEVENPLTGQVRHTGTCYLTCVGLDKNGRPFAVPPLIPETGEERGRWTAAPMRRETRLQLIRKQSKKA